jgi:Tannase and feruloyl esterase
MGRNRLLILAAFAAGGFAIAHGTSAATLPPVKLTASCADLKTIDFSRTHFPPMRLDSAEMVTQGDKQFCAVKGYVASQVNFEVRMPLDGWTQRYLQLGCGGYCGGVSLISPSVNRQTAGCLPVESGEMVVAATDAGHRRSSTFFADGVWAVENPGAVVDFAYAATHKTAQAAKALITAFYGQAPRYSYFTGCSDGGRQGLQAAQRFPDDFDGILAGSTTLDVVATNTVWHGWNARVNARPDGAPILTAEKIPALAKAVVSACAGPDGLIADPRVCSFNVDTLVCPPGRIDASCLTKEQAEVARRLWQGPLDEHGNRLFPGGFPYGSELAWLGAMVPEKPGAAVTVGTASDAQWSWDFPSFMSTLGKTTGVTHQYMTFTKASFESLMQLQGLYDPTNPDLKKFAARGGKLVMWHGWADSGSSPLGSLNYVHAVRGHMAEQSANGFLSLYLVPGVYHCSSGPTPVKADYMSQLIAWVEDGKAPGAVTVSFEAGPNDATVTRTLMVAPHGPSKPNDKTEWLGLANYEPSKQTWCRWDGPNLICDQSAPR